MTRYEVEEIANHVLMLQEMLDEWSIDAKEMEIELAELKRMIDWLEGAMKQNYPDSELKKLLPQLEEKALNCSQCIRERLSARW